MEVRETKVLQWILWRMKLLRQCRLSTLREDGEGEIRYHAVFENVMSLWHDVLLVNLGENNTS
jgi:hypothetical protein